MKCTHFLLLLSKNLWVEIVIYSTLGRLNISTLKKVEKGCQPGELPEAWGNIKIRRRNNTIACGPRSHTECQNKWYVCCHRHPLIMQSQAPSQNMQSWNFLTMFGANSRLDEMKSDCNIGIDMRLQVGEPCCIYFSRDLLPKKVSSSCWRGGLKESSQREQFMCARN